MPLSWQVRVVKYIFNQFPYTLIPDDVRHDKALEGQVLQWRNSFVNSETNTVELMSLNQLVNSIRESRVLYGLLAGILRIVGFLLSSDSELVSIQFLINLRHILLSMKDD